MQKIDRTSLLIFPVLLIVVLPFAWNGSQGSRTPFGITQTLRNWRVFRKKLRQAGLNHPGVAGSASHKD